MGSVLGCPPVPVAVDRVSRFENLRAAFAALNVPLDPAEWHGLLCGATVGGLRSPTAVLDLLEAELATVVVEAPMRSALTDIAADAATDLARFDYGFQLLLPVDDAPLNLRVQALAAWCQGFLAGLGQGGGARGLSADTASALGDFAAIGRADADVDGTEEDERDFVELVEYVRAAVLVIDAELRARQARPDTKLH
ncbi:MAG: hypothetical protein EPO03_04840 [Porticoccaceae bacterium]|nr:MAG: hypothetical protein EPO03_04840 [Porticoccaceae bacterium]